MKHTFAFCSLFLLVACGTNTEKQEPADSVTTDTVAVVETTSMLDSEESIAKRVREIYKTGDEQSKFTASFYQLLGRLKQKDAPLEAAGYLGYLDYGILTQAQDYIEVVNVSVVDITETTAVAVVKTNFETIITLQLKKENGVWKVDNVNDERHQIECYLNE